MRWKGWCYSGLPSSGCSGRELPRLWDGNSKNKMPISGSSGGKQTKEFPDDRKSVALLVNEETTLWGWLDLTRKHLGLYYCPSLPGGLPLERSDKECAGQGAARLTYTGRVSGSLLLSSGKLLLQSCPSSYG